MSAYRCYTARRPVKDDVRLHFRNQMHRLQVGVPLSRCVLGVLRSGLGGPHSAQQRFLRRHADLLRAILRRLPTICLHSTNLNMHRSCNRLCLGRPLSRSC